MRTSIAALLVCMLSISLLTLPANALIRAFDIYMDQPFVQGSYIAPDSDALTEDFNNFPMGGSPTSSCSNATLTVGQVIGTCTVADSAAFGASDTSSNQSIGGTGGKMATGNPGADYRVNFARPMKYVGFWWSAGSNGNTVNFLSNGAVVATVNVNQVYSMFGNQPYESTGAGQLCYGQPNETSTAAGDKCFGNSMNFSDPNAIVTAANSSNYLKNLYFGHPSGYALSGGGPTSIHPSSLVYNEPFVYIHAYAKNGANFDAVQFVGGNFELDNITVAESEKVARGELVFVQSVPGSYTATFDSQGGSAVPTAVFSSGSSLSAPSNPSRSGYVFAGWLDTLTASSAITFPYTPAADDLVLYAKWIPATVPKVWIRISAADSSHDTLTAISSPIASLSADSATGTVNFLSIPYDTSEIDLFAEDVGSTGFTSYQIESYMDNFFPTQGASASRYSVATPANGATTGLKVGLTAHTQPGNIVDNATLLPGLNHFTIQTFGSSTNYIFIVQLFIPSSPPAPSPTPTPTISPSASPSPSPSASPSPSPSASPSPSPSASPSPSQSQSPVPPNPGGTSSGSTPQIPGVEWSPSDLYEGDRVGDEQLNAKFTVPGSVTYSIQRGSTPEVGTVTITVTFAPEDSSRYLAVSITRTFRVMEKTKASPTPTPSPSVIDPTYKMPRTIKISQLKKIGTIYFNNNEYFLDAGDRKILKQLSDTYASNRSIPIYLEGNTDIKGGVDNVLLSKNRAESVRHYLEVNFKLSNCTSMWFASTRPAAFGTSRDSLALNRRVDIYVKEEVEKPANEAKTESTKVSLMLSQITFNRNEFFLDARDRATLVTNVAKAVKAKCLTISLRGSRDSAGGGANNSIAANRVKSVREFMREQYPLLKFSIQPMIISETREVTISCTN